MPTDIGTPPCCCVRRGEATNTNFTVSGLTLQDIEP